MENSKNKKSSLKGSLLSCPWCYDLSKCFLFWCIFPCWLWFSGIHPSGGALFLHPYHPPVIYQQQLAGRHLGPAQPSTHCQFVCYFCGVNPAPMFLQVFCFAIYLLLFPFVSSFFLHSQINLQLTCSLSCQTSASTDLLRLYPLAVASSPACPPARCSAQNLWKPKVGCTTSLSDTHFVTLLKH